MTNRPVALLAASAICAAAFSATAAVWGAANRTVTLKSIAFSPNSLSVSKGSTVTFAFRDGSTKHNVISTPSRRFTSISTRSSGSSRRTFTRAGTYRYVCTLHPGMTGRITVR